LSTLAALLALVLEANVADTTLSPMLDDPSPQ